MGRQGAGGRAASASRQRRRLETRSNTITTTVSLPETLHAQLARAALDRRWTLAELLRVAAREWLARRRSVEGRDEE
jgi:Ribbon-helix-helix protein, copG family